MSWIAVGVGVGSAAGGLLGGLFGGKSKSSISYGFAPRSAQETESYNQFKDFTGKLITETPDFSAAFKATTEAGTAAATGSLPLLSGDFLDPSNPVNKSFIDASNRPLQQQFHEETIPGLEGYLAKSGATGSTRGNDLIRQAYRDFETVLGDNSTKALANIGGTRAAGFQAGAYGEAYASQSVLAILNQVLAAQTQQYNMAQHAVQTGGTATTAPGQAVSQALDLGLEGYVLGKVATTK